MAIFIAALFYDLSTEKQVHIPTQKEKRERDLRELACKNKRPEILSIVERIPVRIALRKNEILKNPIRPGLSTVTSIDVKETKQPLGASLTAVTTPEYKTDIFADEIADAQAKAQAIVMDNLIQENNPSEPDCKSSASAVTKNPDAYR